MQEAAQRLGQLTRPEDPAQAGTHTGGTAPDAGERQEDFEELIRGRYKADFDARVKKILDGRLRGLRQEVTDLRQREKLRQVQIQYYLDRLPEQEKQVRMVHPEFRLQKEMENPRFFRLVQAGVEPREAYEMVHRRELTAKAMHFAAQAAAREEAHRKRAAEKSYVEKGNKDEAFRYHIAKVEEEDDSLQEEPILTNEDLVLGIRPEFLNITSEAPLKGEIYGAMPTGMESTIKVYVNGFLLTGVVFGSSLFTIGEQHSISFTGHHIMLFDRQSGDCIALGSLETL